MRALILLTMLLISGCILRSEDARTNPFGTAEATSATTNEEIERDRTRRMMFERAMDPNRGCGGCS